MTRSRRNCAGYETYVYSSTSAGSKPGTVDLVIWRSAGAEIRQQLHPKAAEALAAGKAVMSDAHGEMTLVEVNNGWFDSRYCYELRFKRELGGDDIVDVIEMTGATGQALIATLEEAAARGYDIQRKRGPV